MIQQRRCRLSALFADLSKGSSSDANGSCCAFSSIFIATDDESDLCDGASGFTEAESDFTEAESDVVVVVGFGDTSVVG